MANVKTYFGTVRAPRRAKADTDAAFKREIERAKAVDANPASGDYERTIAGANLQVAKLARVNALEALWGAVALLRRSSHPFDRRLHGG